ncbi:MAG: HIT family protein [Gemmatimonadales bacterium]
MSGYAATQPFYRSSSGVRVELVPPTTHGWPDDKRMMGNCLFCSVIQRVMPGSFVYEDDRALAFLDMYPVNSGHTLVVPKTHMADLRDCPPDLAAHLFAVSTRLAPAVVAAVEADGFNVWTANGRAAGQTVFHLHLHILPRFTTDAFGFRFPDDYPREAERAELDAVAARIISQV